MPDHVCCGKANKSTVRTSAVEGCIPLQLLWSKSHKLLSSVIEEGTSVSISFSMPSVVTVPETTVIAFSSSTFRSVTLVCLQHVPSDELSFPMKSSAPWQQISAASSGNVSFKPQEVTPLQSEILEADHLATYLKSSVSRVCFNTSSWNAKHWNVKIRILHQLFVYQINNK